MRIREHFNTLLQHMIVRALGRDEEIESYIDSLHYVTADRDDANALVYRLTNDLATARRGVREANSRAHRNACIGLLAMGLFVVQAYGFLLYFAPK